MKTQAKITWILFLSSHKQSDVLYSMGDDRLNLRWTWLESKQAYNQFHAERKWETIICATCGWENAPAHSVRPAKTAKWFEMNLFRAAVYIYEMRTFAAVFSAAYSFLYNIGELLFLAIWVLVVFLVSLIQYFECDDVRSFCERDLFEKRVKTEETLRTHWHTCFPSRIL